MGANTLRAGLVAFTVLAIAAITNMVMLQPTSGRRAAAKPRPDAAGELRTDAAKLRSDERAQSHHAAKADPKPETPPAAASAATSAQDVTRAVQRELKERGYEAGVADGQPGLMTRAAIMAYEHDRGMNLTGEPSPQLLKQILLNAGPPPAQAPRTAASQEQSMHATQVIRTVQQSLVTLGYLPGKVDGRMGDDTVRAIREFELDQGLHETGRVSGQLVARLSRLAGQGRLGSSR